MNKIGNFIANLIAGAYMLFVFGASAYGFIYIGKTILFGSPSTPSASSAVYATTAPTIAPTPEPTVYIPDHGPYYYQNQAADDYGPSALCADGTESYSSSRRGTCSHHGGVSEWY